jgi:hypothetical protein
MAATKITDLVDEADSSVGVALALRNKMSFRTASLAGLYGRHRDVYYRGFAFNNPGRLPEDKAVVFRLASNENIYTLFLGDTPVAWYAEYKGWTVPELTGFTEAGMVEYTKAREALASIGAL